MPRFNPFGDCYDVAVESINKNKEDMTKLMPVVGNKYKSINESVDDFCMTITEVNNKFHFYDWSSKNENINGHGKGLTKNFWANFEELPKKPTNAKNAQVEEAKQELKKLCLQSEVDKRLPFSTDYNQWMIWYRELQDKAQNLLNALDEQDKPETLKERIKNKYGFEDNEEAKLDAITARQWAVSGRDYYSSAEYATLQHERRQDKIRKLLNNKIEKPLTDNKIQATQFAVGNFNSIFGKGIGGDEEKRQEEPKSIWRNINELPTPRINAIVFVNIGNMYSIPANYIGDKEFSCLENKRLIRHEVTEWCYPSDIIKNVEHLKGAVGALEERVKKLEGK